MAVRFDTNGDYLVRTASLPAQTGFTLTFWMKYKGTGGAYRPGICSYSCSVAADSARIAWDSDGGTTYQLRAGSSVNLKTGICTVDQWYFIVLQGNGTGVNGFKAAMVGTGDSIALSATSPSSGSSWTNMRLGGPDSNADMAWGDFSVAGAKCWQRLLTNAELETERYKQLVVDETNLWAYWPLSVHTDLTDSFADNDWTAAGTLSTEASDPPWSGRNPVAMDFGLS